MISAETPSPPQLSPAAMPAMLFPLEFYDTPKYLVLVFFNDRRQARRVKRSVHKST